MGVNLSDMFYKDQYHTGMQTNTAAGTPSASSDSVSGEIGSPLALQPGQQFRGTVVAVDGDYVSIRTQDDQVFRARLENGVNLTNGMSLRFEVKGIQNGQISLTPLYSNLDQASSVYKALQMAELPVSENSVQMVNEMMNQGMSIDKQSLQNMFHLTGQFDTTNAATIVQMKQLQLPVSEQNIEQFESYRNNTAQILDGYREIGTQVTELMQGMADQGDFEALGRLFTQVMKAVSENGLLQRSPGENAQSTDSVQAGMQQSGEAAVTDELLPESQKTFMEGMAQTGKEIVMEAAVQNGMLDDMEEAVQNGKSADMEEVVQNGKSVDMEKTADTASGKWTQQEIREEPAVQGTDRASLAKDANTMGKALEVLEEAFRRTGENDFVTENAERDTFAQNLQNIRKSQPLSETWFREFLDSLSATTEGKSGAEQAAIYQEAGQVLSRLLQRPEFENRMQDLLTRNWLLKPQEVAQKDQIQALYEKVLRQTENLKAVLNDAGKNDSAAMKSVQNLSRNVEFLNELNHNFSLVQLPLKMSEQKAHGDLYVYTNKRNFASDKGAVTALLHLAMDHLGDMDIYVAMQNRKVSTKFYLESDEIISFLEEHMAELDRRLAQKGYDMHSELLQKDHKDSGNVFEQMLTDSKSGGRTPLVMVSRQSFDARA